MAQKAVFYHAGCPVCVDAEKRLAFALDPRQFEVEIVHLGEKRSRIAEAEAAGGTGSPPVARLLAPYRFAVDATGCAGQHGAPRSAGSMQERAP